MKKNLFISAMAGAILLLGHSACKKSAATPTNPITPLQKLINTDTSLTWFHELLLNGNESGLLADDSVTLLLPTNDVFRAAGWIIDSIGSADAARITSYLVLNGRVIPQSSEYTASSTMLGFNIYGLKDSSGIWFNGSSVSADTMQVGKALVYHLNTPIFPAYDSLGALLGADSSLTIFYEAFTLSGLDSSLLTSNYTVLAPVNSAFIAYGYDSPAAIDSADSSTIAGIVKNQILVTGSAYTNILMGLGSASNLNGNAITITHSGGVLQFSGSGNSTPANYVDGNLTGGNNFAIHRIDQVLR